ncbi:MAG: cell division protein FtsL [Treponema sp.]|jgi:cell division protein FtsL|nr:cell division protein FtsL [Treponema sp.]
MMGRTLLLYFTVLSIPVLFGLNAWQAVRYTALERETMRFEDAQEQWIESNKRLIAGIAVLSSSERVENIALHDLELEKIAPEAVLQIKITGASAPEREIP